MNSAANYGFQHRGVRNTSLPKMNIAHISKDILSVCFTIRSILRVHEVSLMAPCTSSLRRSSHSIVVPNMLISPLIFNVPLVFTLRRSTSSSIGCSPLNLHHARQFGWLMDVPEKAALVTGRRVFVFYSANLPCFQQLPSSWINP